MLCEIVVCFWEHSGHELDGADYSAISQKRTRGSAITDALEFAARG